MDFMRNANYSVDNYAEPDKSQIHLGTVNMNR